MHGSYLRALVAAARRDEIVTDAERADLEDVAALLAVESDVLKELLAAPFVDDGSTFASDNRAESLAGMTVCFTGQLTCTIAGEVIAREDAETLARTRRLCRGHFSDQRWCAHHAPFNDSCTCVQRHLLLRQHDRTHRPRVRHALRQHLVEWTIRATEPSRVSRRLCCPRKTGVA